MKYPLIYTPLILFILFSCASSKSLQYNTTIIELEKTECNGHCPVYKLQIKGNGTIMLNAIANLEIKGDYKSNLSNKQLNDLVSDFENIGFFDLNDSYTSLMMDLPTKYISFTKNSKTKKIMAYDKVPKKLDALIKKIDSLIVSLNWEKVN